MACSSCAKRREQQRFQVKKNGKTLYASGNETTANAVARNYPGAVVEDRQAQNAGQEPPKE